MTDELSCKTIELDEGRYWACRYPEKPPGDGVSYHGPCSQCRFLAKVHLRTHAQEFSSGHGEEFATGDARRPISDWSPAPHLSAWLAFAELKYGDDSD